MTLKDTTKRILSSTGRSLTPQEIREVIKNDYPDFYGKKSHIRNVKKGHYKDLDHALLAQIYSTIKNSKHFISDTTSRPMKISLETKEGTRRPKGDAKRTEKRRRFSLSVKASQFEEKVAKILKGAEKYHEAYYKAETFRGPSLYFHQRALETRQVPGSIKHLEYVYATLSSWGMHRMGKGGSKMESFENFSRSIDPLQSRLIEAQQFDFHEIDDPKWTILKEIFLGLKVMASGTSLVGNSKVMHHMLPNIVPSIDREYTLWYLLGNKSVKNDLDWEWGVMKEIITNFFIPVASDREFDLMAQEWIAKKDKYPWDTSFMKIVDNLVIGLKK